MSYTVPPRRQAPAVYKGRQDTRGKRDSYNTDGNHYCLLLLWGGSYFDFITNSYLLYSISNCCKTNDNLCNWPLCPQFVVLVFVNNTEPSMDGYIYSPWSSKNFIDWNWPKKFMQVCVDVPFIHIDFGGRGLSGFGDTITLKNSQISLLDHGL